MHEIAHATGDWVNRPYLCRVAYFNATALEMGEQLGEMFAIPGFDRAQNVDG